MTLASRLMLVAGAIVGMFLIACMTIGQAHDLQYAGDRGPFMKNWMDGLKDKKGVGCCSTADGEDVAWGIRPQGTGYWVIIDGEKRDVPPEAVIEGPNHFGHAQIWTWQSWEMGRKLPFKNIRCFIPGAGG